MTTPARARAHSTGRLSGSGPSKKRGGRPSPGRTRRRGGVLILLSLAAAVLCGLTFAVWLPSQSEHYQEYRAAEPCPARPTAQERGNCLSTWHFTVVKTETVNSGKTHDYDVTLKGADSWQSVVKLDDDRPLFDKLEQGDRVTATVWRRDIVVLGKDGVRQNTTDAPRYDLGLSAAYGMIAGLLAVELFAFGAIRLFRPRSRWITVWDARAGWVFAITPVACFALGLGAMALGIPWGFVVPAAPLVVLFVGWSMGGLIDTRGRRGPAARA